MMRKGLYKLTLADHEGVLLNTWTVQVGDGEPNTLPDPESYNIAKPMARQSVMQEIVNEIEIADQK